MGGFPVSSEPFPEPTSRVLRTGRFDFRRGARSPGNAPGPLGWQPSIVLSDSPRKLPRIPRGSPLHRSYRHLEVTSKSKQPRMFLSVTVPADPFTQFWLIVVGVMGFWFTTTAPITNCRPLNCSALDPFSSLDPDQLLLSVYSVLSILLLHVLTVVLSSGDRIFDWHVYPLCGSRSRTWYLDRGMSPEWSSVPLSRSITTDPGVG